MLTSVPTKQGAGITIYGDFYDLSALHETIHKIAGQSWVDEGFGDYMLGLAYDIRKAFEGQREKRTFGFDPLEKVTYRAVSILWPHVLTQAGMVRHFAAFHTTDHKDQACLYLLEDCLITSLLAFDQAAGKECAEWLVKFRVFPNDYLFNFVTDVCCRKYLFETPAKKRFKTLPAILRMLDWWSPEYKAYAEATKKTAEKLECSPKLLRDEREWPTFKW